MADVPVNSSNANTVVIVTADGQVDFDYDFRADAAGDLKATYKDAAGVETALLGGVDFTVSGLRTASGGTITLVSLTATVAGDTLTIYRDIQVSRPNDYSRDLFANDLNSEQDKVFMILQQHRRDIGRAVKVSIGSEGMSIAPGEVGQIPAYDVNGNLIPTYNVFDATLAKMYADEAKAAAEEAKSKTKINPFTGRATIIGDFPGTFWPAGAWYDPDTNIMHRIDVVAERHDGSSGAWVDHLQSHDSGETWRDRVTIFSDPANLRARAGAFGIMSNGRWGGIITTGDTTRKQFFVYTDDKGVSWTFVDITASVPLANHFVYGMLLPGPSGASGDWMVSSYGGTRAAKLLRTLDNGASWSDRVLRDASGLPGSTPNPSEQSIVHVPDHGWIMFTRVETTPVAANNMFISVSSDGLNYGPWIDSGLAIGSNPVHAVYDNGKVHVLIVQRDGFPGTTRPDVLYCYSVDGEDLFNNPAVIFYAEPVQVAALEQRATAYVQSCRMKRASDDDNAPWYHYLKAGEGPSSTLRAVRAKSVAIRDLPGAARGVKPSPSPVQLIENPIFSVWPRGTSFNLSSDAGLAGRWRVVTSGSTVLVDRVTLTAAERLRFPFRPEFGMRIRNTGDPDNFVGFAQRFLENDAKKALRTLLHGGDYIVRLYGKGAFPSHLECNLSTNVGTFAVGTFKKVPAGQTASWVTEARLLITATAPDISAVTHVQVGVSNGTTASEFDFTAVGMFLYPAGLDADLEFNEHDDTEERVARYTRELTGVGLRVGSGNIKSATNAVIYLPIEMATSPDIAFSDLSHFVVESAGDHALAAVTPSSGPLQATFTIELAGASPGFATIRIVHADGRITLDTGW